MNDDQKDSGSRALFSKSEKLDKWEHLSSLHSLKLESNMYVLGSKWLWVKNTGYPRNPIGK